MNKRVMTIIIIMMIISFISNFAHPVTPELVESIGYGPILYGTLFATMSAAIFFMSPFWGSLSDKYGRKLFIVIGPIGYGLAQLGFGFSTTPLVIIVFRFLAGGFSSAAIVSGMAYLIDVSNTEHRTKIMAFYTAVTGFASTIGNLVGGVIGNLDYHRTFIVQGFSSIFFSLLILLFLKESRHKTQVNRRSNIIADFLKYKNTGVPFLLIMTLLTSFMAIGFNTSFNSYMKMVLHRTPKEIGQVMAITGTIGLIMNVGFFPLIKKKFNDYYSLMISIFFMTISLGLANYFVKDSFRQTLVILIIFFAFLALYRPLLQSIISKMGRANGEIMGLNNAFSALGMVGGSFYAGFMFDTNVNFTFYSISFIGLVVFSLLLSRKNKFQELG